jgi:hypothetical protein
MADLDDILTALATRISTGMAGTALAGRTTAFAPDSIVTPWVICLPAPGNFVTYDVTLEGKDDFELIVKILVGSEVTRAGQQALLSYLDRTGSTSIRAAIYGDRTLGGVVADLKVESAQGYGDVEWAGIPYFGAELVVSVMT